MPFLYPEATVANLFCMDVGNFERIGRTPVEELK